MKTRLRRSCLNCWTWVLLGFMPLILTPPLFIILTLFSNLIAPLFTLSQGVIYSTFHRNPLQAPPLKACNLYVVCSCLVPDCWDEPLEFLSAEQSVSFLPRQSGCRPCLSDGDSHRAFIWDAVYPRKEIHAKTFRDNQIKLSFRVRVRVKVTTKIQKLKVKNLKCKTWLKAE